MSRTINTNTPRARSRRNSVPACLPAALGAVLMLCAWNTSAALIGIDFNNIGGATPTNWNGVAPAVDPLNLNNLIDEDGAATNVDFSLSGVSYDDFTASVSAATVPTHSNDLSNLTDYWWDTSGSVNGTFSDLVAGGSYKLWVIGLRAFTPLNNDVTIVHGGTNISFNQFANAGQLFINDQIGSSANTFDSYALNVTARDNGTIRINIQAGTSIWALGGIAIEQVSVPEPGTLALLGISLAGLGWRHRGARKQ